MSLPWSKRRTFAGDFFRSPILLDQIQLTTVHYIAIARETNDGNQDPQQQAVTDFTQSSYNSYIGGLL
jgi:hypothetical protein